MRALSLLQPWATLIVDGLHRPDGTAWRKISESRTWSTSYRGPLVLCASRGIDAEAAEVLGIGGPRGVTICLVDLVDCVRAEPDRDGPTICPPELAPFGYGWLGGRFAWRLSNVRRLQSVPVRGQLGLFDLSAEAVVLADGTAPALPPMRGQLGLFQAWKDPTP